jgi:hypothetical protein
VDFQVSTVEADRRSGGLILPFGIVKRKLSKFGAKKSLTDLDLLNSNSLIFSSVNNTRTKNTIIWKVRRLLAFGVVTFFGIENILILAQRKYKIVWKIV